MKTSRFIIVVVAIFFAGAVSAFVADVTGAWTGQFAPDMNPSNAHKFVLDLKVDGTKLSGTMGFCRQDCTNPTGKVVLQNGRVDGDVISFGIDTDAQDVPHIDFQGTVTGNSINFIVSGKAPNCAPDTSCQIGQGSATRSTSPH